MFPNIRAELARKGMTIGDLAGKLNLCQRSVSQKLRGQRQWRLSEIVAMAKEFSCSCDYLAMREVTS